MKRYIDTNAERERETERENKIRKIPGHIIQKRYIDSECEKKYKSACGKCAAITAAVAHIANAHTKQTIQNM